MEAVAAGHESMVRLLVQRGASVSYEEPVNGRRALHLAAQHGHGLVLQALLELGAQSDVNIPSKLGPGGGGGTALIIAADMGSSSHVEVVSLLLRTQGVDVNHATHKGVTALFVASQGNHTTVARVLLADLRTGRCTT